MPLACGKATIRELQTVPIGLKPVLLGWHHHVTLVSLAFAFLRTEQSRAKKTAGAKPMPATLPQTRARLQVRLIHLAGQCLRCKMYFKTRLDT